MDAGAWNKVEWWIPGGPQEKVAPSGCREPPVDSVPCGCPLDCRDWKMVGRKPRALLCIVCENDRLRHLSVINVEAFLLCPKNSL